MTRINKQRQEWTQTRIEQAYAAAENGDGWTDLGRQWGGMSSSGALMWCRNHLPVEVMGQIGRNGIAKLKGAHPNKGRRYEFARPPMQHFNKREPVHYDTCQRWFYEPGNLHQCGAESDGKPHCAECVRQLSAGPTGRRYSFSEFARNGSARFAA